MLIGRSSSTNREQWHVLREAGRLLLDQQLAVLQPGHPRFLPFGSPAQRTPDLPDLLEAGYVDTRPIELAELRRRRRMVPGSPVER